MATRRSFIAGLAALAMPMPSWADVGCPAYVAAGKLRTGNGIDSYLLNGLSAQGSPLFRVALPGRGHAAATHPVRPLVVAFARRPGTFALVIDCARPAVSHRLAPPLGRQFNGHGVFSADGAMLYTSEVIAETSQGRIGLWETAAFARIGEWASGGIGPHDIKRLSDGALVVANGGIATDPADRSKLNLEVMRPNLTRIAADGRITDQAELEPALRQNSIRHLAVGPDDRVAFAMQWEGDVAEPVPLLGLWRPGHTPQVCAAHDADAYRMLGYAGSIAMAADGQIAMTSAHGGVIMLFSPEGAPIVTHARADISGVAAAPGGAFVASDGLGALWTCDTTALRLLTSNGPLWDNHLVALAP